MKNRKCAATLLAAAVISAGVLTGCGNNMLTEEEVVVSKEQGEGNMAGAASGNIAEQVQAPKIYRAEVSADAVRMTAEAEVSIPDAAGIKTKKVIPRIFTQEDYEAVSRVLLDGGTLLKWEDDNHLYGTVTADGQDYCVQIDNHSTTEINNMYFNIYKMDRDGNRNYLEFSYEKPDLENLDDIMEGIKVKPGLENMDIPAKEVEAKAEDAIKEMGIGEYALQRGQYFASWKEDDAGADAPMYLAGIGYGVYFARIVDGIPVIHTLQNGSMDYGEEPMSIWYYESLQLVYNNEGLGKFEWRDPYTVEDLSADYVFLMPFSDISDIFEEILLKTEKDNFMNEGDSVDIQVKQVCLGYMRVREKGAMEGTLIPVWDFFGVKSYTNAAGEVYYVNSSADESLLTLNAMDGTVINRWDAHQ